MSEEVGVDTSTSCCASCGIAEVDDVKLKECDDCDLIRYCSDECQRDHRSQHEEACKKRASELRDELLFKQPESTHLGDCPICMIPLLPDLEKKCTTYHCCSKLICHGCYHANLLRQLEAKTKSNKCPFCREAMPGTVEGIDEQRMKRIKMDDPDALTHQGLKQYEKGDYSGAFEYFTKGTQLGDAEAHFLLAVLYDEGVGAVKDERKGIYYLEEAAIGGHPTARYNLGCHELNIGNIERGVKHLVIAATQGDDRSIKALMKLFKVGFVSKEELAAALRAHQAAVDAFKSPQRDKAEEFARSNGILI